MAHLCPIQSGLKADQFLSTDQGAFGDAWRYELIDGEIVGDAAASPAHARILAGLMRALGNRFSGSRTGCYPEAGSGAVPERKQRNTARIPDAANCREQFAKSFRLRS